ncbi:MAG: 2-hydroxyacyl-CoA dehydratase, partial [Clostridia bacterium]|nr:2-hydroxyacyl-CoA dehydratase [Clostridia bacterium]
FKESNLLNLKELCEFTHSTATSVCNGCANHCHLTINCFSDGKKYISGNQCQNGIGVSDEERLPNLYDWKRKYLTSLLPVEGKRGKIGLPMALSMYELAPLWYSFFTALGFEVHFSALSNHKTYEKGQLTIPSDTACYPAKIMHGHVVELLDKDINTLFYPGLTYNIDEHAGDNHYNCPVVAYYAELLNGNMDRLKKVNFLYPYLNIENAETLTRTIYQSLHTFDKTITKREVKKAAKAAFSTYKLYTEALHREGEKAICFAEKHGKRVMILAGRPYHVDPEIGHGIDKLANSLGFVVVSEDSVCHMSPVQYVKVLDQWTFHSRLYRAARYATEHKNTELVQLVSFGCGVDAITTDEIRSILENNGKHYTQLKIDEITNLGAVKIRLRSLLGALEESE